MTSDASVPGGPARLGFFLLTLATLLHEILLTRIFSVTMWYHFAFMAISVSMFGLTAGALVVRHAPGWFAGARVKTALATCALLFALAIPFSFLTHLSIPFVSHSSITGYFSVGLTYVTIAIPFVFSGICVTLMLTRFPTVVGELYAIDLAGAAAGCLLFPPLLDVTDGPTAVFVVATVAAASAWLLSTEAGSRKFGASILALAVALGAFSVWHTGRVARNASLVPILWVKGERQETVIHEKWNGLARIEVRGNPAVPLEPYAWGMSPKYPKGTLARQLWMVIDACAGTSIVGAEDDPAKHDYLRHDVVNMAHWIRESARVLVVGVGGGRDVVSALVFGQKSVVGIEINPDTLDTINRVFGDFTGHRDRDPRVSMVVDEARSWIARSTEKFDIIQISLIDTWAATAAGAFVLSENSLYTAEAWDLFLSRLTENGILTVSRWYGSPLPAETYRTLALAGTALRAAGAADPRQHLALLRCLRTSLPGVASQGVGTLLVSRRPFTAAELDRIDAVADRMGFDVMLSPRVAKDPVLAALGAGRMDVPEVAALPVDVSPPTDDRPFFFQMLRLQDALNRDRWAAAGLGWNVGAVKTLFVLTIFVTILAVMLVAGSRLMWKEPHPVPGLAGLALYFAAIGLGFMMIEVPMMQRLVVFLGHPTYGLTVVLFTLLLASGIGSRTVTGTATGSRLWLLLGALVVTDLASTLAARAFAGATTPVRIGVAVALLALPGFFMGMAFPLGMRLVTGARESAAPWLWAVNGAASICGSVYAMVVALALGLRAAFFVGVACYAVALIAHRVSSASVASEPAPGA